MREGYSDVNWISDSFQSKSPSGYVFLLGGASVSRKSAKQTVRARSTMEAELVALDLAGTQAEWLRQLLLDISLIIKPLPPISLH